MKANSKRKKLKRNLISNFAHIPIKTEYNKVAYYEEKNNKNNKILSNINYSIYIKFRR